MVFTLNNLLISRRPIGRRRREASNNNNKQTIQINFKSALMKIIFDFVVVVWYLSFSIVYLRSQVIQKQSS